MFHEEEEPDETNVKRASVAGPNSGLMDVEALRIRARMEMLSFDVIVVVVVCRFDWMSATWGDVCATTLPSCYFFNITVRPVSERNVSNRFTPILEMISINVCFRLLQSLL